MTGDTSSLLDPLTQVSSDPHTFTSHEYRRYWCQHCGYHFDIPTYCGNRLCPVCSKQKRIRARLRLTGLVRNVKPAKGNDIRFLTLTIPNVPDIEAGMLTIVRAFRRLRQRQVWKNHVLGGVFVLEATGRPNNWHCHIHALIEGTYFPVRTISRVWQAVSPGKVVWITRIPHKAAIGYLTKYLTKPNLPSEVTDEMGRALAGFRMFQPFGSWHGIKVTIPKRPYRCPTCGLTCWTWQNPIFYDPASYPATHMPRSPT